MIDIVNFYKDKVQQWNDENKCGFCYSFGAPLFNSELNIQQIEDCCLNVFLVNYNIKPIYKNDNVFFGYQNIDYFLHNFDLYLILPSELGINNYNEISGHPIEESKWKTIFFPLINCFSVEIFKCENINNFAGFIIDDISLVHNYLDNVYNGIKIKGKIKIMN